MFRDSRDDNLDEISAPPAIEEPQGHDIQQREYLEDSRQKQKEQDNGGSKDSKPEQSSSDGLVEEREDGYDNLDEVDDPAPIQNRGERRLYTHETLEERRESQQAERREGSHTSKQKYHRSSTFATHLYTISYLIFFAIMGTLARLGLQALTFYPGAPVAFSELWANVGGTFIIGFLSEDQRLFREEWGDDDDGQTRRPKSLPKPHPKDLEKLNSEAFKKQHGTVKKTIPLYIGLAVGFCGSFTSFSSFIRDVFFALSNDLPTPLSHPNPQAVTASTTTVPRNGGYSFMAILAVIFTTVSLCMGALMAGAQLAEVLERYTPTLPFRFTRRVVDPLFVFLGWGSWLAAIIMAIFPPDRPGGPAARYRSSSLQETWRGQVLFALVFAPVGCLARFYASLHLNGRIASFPLGTFAVNAFGTLVLGLAFDLQHAPLQSAAGAVGGGLVGCQVLQGIQDGFCGCLTTVSTWIAELKALRLAHSYRYGVASVLFSLALLVVVMGSLRWTDGFAAKACG